MGNLEKYASVVPIGQGSCGSVDLVRCVENKRYVRVIYITQFKANVSKIFLKRVLTSTVTSSSTGVYIYHSHCSFDGTMVSHIAVLHLGKISYKEESQISCT